MVDYDGEVDRFCTTFFAIPNQALLFFILILPVEEQQDYLKRCTKSGCSKTRNETKQIGETMRNRKPYSLNHLPSERMSETERA